MTDLSDLIIAKSDQLNSDDLISGAITIKITGIKKTSGEQPISLNYAGDKGKPWKPCKGMMRVMVAIWGTNGDAYIGKHLTLYRDEKVKWAGMEVGGIRISHMEGIKEPFVFALTASKGNKKPYIVKPLIINQDNTPEVKTLSDDDILQLKNDGKKIAESGLDELKAWWKSIGVISQKAIGIEYLDELKAIANNVVIL